MYGDRSLPPFTNRKNTTSTPDLRRHMTSPHLRFFPLRVFPHDASRTEREFLRARRRPGLPWGKFSGPWLFSTAEARTSNLPSPGRWRWSMAARRHAPCGSFAPLTCVRPFRGGVVGAAGSLLLSSYPPMTDERPPPPASCHSPSHPTPVGHLYERVCCRSSSRDAARRCGGVPLHLDVGRKETLRAGIVSARSIA